MVIDILIPFEPVPWAAPKLSRYGHAYDIREKDKRVIRYCIKEQYTGSPIDRTTIITMKFFFGVPKSFAKKKREAALKGEIIPTRCDCTNLQKLYEDCLKGIVIKDDRNVSLILSHKLYAEKSSVSITVYCDDPHADSY